MTEAINWLTVGKLVAPQGLQGEIRVNPTSDFPERFIKPGLRWVQEKNEKPRKVKLLCGRRIPGKSLFIVSLAGVINRHQAELLIGKKLLVPSSERPVLKENEFHLLDLLGLEVKLKNDNELIGEITNLITAGNDLLEIKLLDGKTVLIPFVKEIVPVVDIKKGFIILSPPKGLLDL